MRLCEQKLLHATNYKSFSTFIHSASLDAFGSLLDARALPALPVLYVSILHRRFGALRMTLHVAVTAVTKLAFVLTYHTNIHFGVASAVDRNKF